MKIFNYSKKKHSNILLGLVLNYNIKYWDSKDTNELFEEMDDDDIRLVINRANKKDSNLINKGGFRKGRLPELKFVKNAIRNKKQIPLSLFVEILENMNEFKSKYELIDEIRVDYNIDPAKSVFDETPLSFCIPEKYKLYCDKYKNKDVILTLSYYGIVITNETEKLQIEKNPIINNPRTEIMPPHKKDSHTVSEIIIYLQKHQNNIEDICTTIKRIKDHANEMISLMREISEDLPLSQIIKNVKVLTSKSSDLQGSHSYLSNYIKQLDIKKSVLEEMGLFSNYPYKKFIESNNYLTSSLTFKNIDKFHAELITFRKNILTITEKVKADEDILKKLNRDIIKSLTLLGEIEPSDFKDIHTYREIKKDFANCKNIEYINYHDLAQEVDKNKKICERLDNYLNTWYNELEGSLSAKDIKCRETYKKSSSAQERIDAIIKVISLLKETKDSAKADAETHSLSGDMILDLLRYAKEIGNKNKNNGSLISKMSLLLLNINSRDYGVDELKVIKYLIYYLWNMLATNPETGKDFNHNKMYYILIMVRFYKQDSNNQMESHLRHVKSLCMSKNDDIYKLIDTIAETNYALIRDDDKNICVNKYIKINDSNNLIYIEKFSDSKFKDLMKIMLNKVSSLLNNSNLNYNRKEYIKELKEFAKKSLSNIYSENSNVKFKEIPNEYKKQLEKEFKLISKDIDLFIRYFNPEKDYHYEFPGQYPSALAKAIEFAFTPSTEELIKADYLCDEREVIPLIRKHIMSTMIWYQYQPKTIEYLYNNEIGSLAQYYNLIESNYKETEHDYFIKKAIYTSYSIAYFSKAGVGIDEIKEWKNKKGTLEKTISLWGYEISSEFHDAYSYASNAQCYDLCKEIKIQSDNEKKSKIEEGKRAEEADKSKLKSTLNQFNSIIYDIDKDSEFYKDLYELKSKIDLILLHNHPTEIRYLSDKADLINKAIEEKDSSNIHAILNNLNEEIQPEEDQVMEIRFAELKDYFLAEGASSKITKEIKDRIDNSENINDLRDFIEDITKLESSTVNYNSQNYKIDNTLKKIAANFLAVYGLPNYNSFNSTPFFVTGTMPLTNQFMHKTIILSVISGKDYKNEANTFCNSLYNFMVSENNPAPNDCILVLLVLVDTKHKVKIRHPRFEQTILLTLRDICKHILDGAMSKMLYKQIIKSYPLSELNPFQAEQVVCEGKGIFVGRKEILSKLSRDNTSYAIYGARRIGKSSICKMLEHKLSQNNYIVIYITMSYSNKDDPSFKKGLIICNRIMKELGESIDLESYDKFRDIIEEKYIKRNRKKLCLIIDEIDNYIKNLDDYYKHEGIDNRYDFFNVLRDLINKNNDKFKLILSGYVTLYDKLRSRYSTPQENNPFGNFINTEAITSLTEKEGEELLNKLND
ncbi:MAG: ATP-binding protein, partial [Ignavibacteria bacterium]|nr:ATP-binding protein [Ignavibacteria bacterium]